MKQNLKYKLNAIAKMANAGKLQRLLYAPKKYISGQFFFRAIYQQTKKGRLVKAQTFFNKEMNVLLPAGMDIYLLGAKTHDSEIRLTKWMLNNVQTGNTVLDIGTHFGFYALLAAHLVGEKGIVIGIEASKAVHEVSQKNVSDSPNVKLFHLAATDENTRLSFYEFPILYSEYNTIDPDQFKDSNWVKNNPPLKIEVEGKKADILLEECKAIPNFIKIDVEGAEAKVIAGLHRTLKEHNPIVALEYLSDARTNSAHVQAAQQLFDLGYAAYFIGASGDLAPCENLVEDMKRSGVDSDNVIFKK